MLYKKNVLLFFILLFSYSSYTQSRFNNSIDNKNISKPIANKPSPLYYCGNYNDNRGFQYFDLTIAEPQVLGKQVTDREQFLIEYFASQDEANNLNSKGIINPRIYLNTIAFEDKIWIRLSNIANKNLYDVNSLNLVVPIIIKPKLDSEYFVCEDYETKTIISPAILNCGSSPNEYFIWKLGDTDLGEHGPILTTDIPGNYSVTMYYGCGGISTTVYTTVTKYSPYISVAYTDFLENNSFIVVNVLGKGSSNYEYQLDNNGYQESNVFYNILSGEHLISVRDKDGFCSPTPIKLMIVNYPKFFTPNGDGYNDLWNIFDLSLSNPNALVSIFDRSGKLIKEITPSTLGWNGTFNGQSLPSTDYWFTVQYDDKGSRKIFRSHFALKR